jgi:hypothetical protein
MFQNFKLPVAGKFPPMAQQIGKYLGQTEEMLIDDWIALAANKAPELSVLLYCTQVQI